MKPIYQATSGEVNAVKAKLKELRKMAEDAYIARDWNTHKKYTQQANGFEECLIMLGFIERETTEMKIAREQQSFAREYEKRRSEYEDAAYYTA